MTGVGYVATVLAIEQRLMYERYNTAIIPFHTPSKRNAVSCFSVRSQGAKVLIFLIVVASLRARDKSLKSASPGGFGPL